MNIDIEGLEKINPRAVEVLKGKFTTDMKPDPDNALLWVDYDGTKRDLLGRGEIMPIQGKSGVGKGVVIEMILGSCLSGQVSIFKSKGINNIIHIDTEQSKNQWLCSSYRVLRYAKIGEVPNGFVSLHLKKYATDERPLLVNDIIMSSEKVDLIIIDGIADILFNENDIEGAKSLIDDIQKWIDTKGAGFITVLHENKAKDNDFMKGHMGSYLNQKATTVLAVKKEWDSNIMEVKPMKTRGKYWKSQEFYINDMKMVDTGEEYEPSEVIQGGRDKKVSKEEIISNILKF